MIRIEIDPIEFAGFLRRLDLSLGGKGAAAEVGSSGPQPSPGEGETQLHTAVSLEEVQEIAKALCQNCGAEALKAILKRHGLSYVTDCNVDQLPALMADIALEVQGASQ